MYPVMPSLTFVNFYSLATGLYPEHHGMVTNYPYDPTTGEIFDVATGPQQEKWWQGEPIWITDRKSTRLNSSHSQISYSLFFFLSTRRPPTSPLFPSTTLSRSPHPGRDLRCRPRPAAGKMVAGRADLDH